ncbi:DUF2461 domain-containing protein [Jiulongibacter sp. NS-SX5]|uniref:DUF2461 domain-containing protein n=1 Tax=Jiulongibacter sp. NS-SX5 TaxID=3463854 RepID=UPI004057E9AC
MKKVFSFLEDLRENNHREWFEKNRNRYEEALAIMVSFADEVLEQMSEFDVLENPTGKKCLQRIYRDTRFSKDKTPYKNHWGLFLRRAGENRRGGFYLHLEPGNSFIGGGFWGPNAEDLKQIRAQLDADASEYEAVINSEEFIKMFGEVQGQKLKKAPKGFSPDHEKINFLKHKQFLLKVALTDELIFEPNLVEYVTHVFRGMLPYFEVMTAYLTTDLNGEPLMRN